MSDTDYVQTDQALVEALLQLTTLSGSGGLLWVFVHVSLTDTYGWIVQRRAALCVTVPVRLTLCVSRSVHDSRHNGNVKCKRRGTRWASLFFFDFEENYNVVSRNNEIIFLVLGIHGQGVPIRQHVLYVCITISYIIIQRCAYGVRVKPDNQPHELGTQQTCTINLNQSSTDTWSCDHIEARR